MAESNPFVGATQTYNAARQAPATGSVPAPANPFVGASGGARQTGPLTRAADRAKEYSRPDQGGLMAAVRGFNRSIPFSDEIVSGLLTVADPSRSFSEHQQEQSALRDQAFEQHPNAYGAGYVGGTVATMVPVAKAVSAAGRVILPAVERVAGGRAASIAASKPVALAAEGAATGAIQGFADAEGGLTDRAQGAAGGALVGGGIGGALGAVAIPARYGVQLIGNLGKRAAAALDRQRMYPQFAREGLGPEASKIVLNTLPGGRGLDINAIRAAGPEAMVADAGDASSNFLGVATQASTSEKAARAAEAINDRASGSARGVIDALDTAAGASVGKRGLKQGISDTKGKAATAAYNDSYTKALDYSSPEGQFLTERMFPRLTKGDLEAANEIAHRNGRSPIRFTTDADGMVTLSRNPTVQELDDITRGMADRENALFKAGERNRSQPIAEVRRNIRATLKEMAPEFGTASRLGKESIEARNAVDFGYNMLKSNRYTPDEIIADLGAMTDDEKSYAIKGLRSYLDDVMAKTKRTKTTSDTDLEEAFKVVRELSSKANQDIITAAVGRDSAEELFRNIRYAESSLDLARRVSSGQTMARVNATNRAGRDAVSNPLLGSTLPGESGILERLGRTVLGITPQAQNLKLSQAYGDIADIMTRDRGDEAVRTAERLSAILRSTKTGGQAEAVDPATVEAVTRALARNATRVGATAAGRMQNTRKDER